MSCVTSKRIGSLALRIERPPQRRGIDADHAGRDRPALSGNRGHVISRQDR